MKKNIYFENTTCILHVTFFGARNKTPLLTVLKVTYCGYFRFVIYLIGWWDNFSHHIPKIWDKSYIDIN